MYGHDRKPYGPKWDWKSWFLLIPWFIGMFSIVFILYLFLKVVLTISTNT